MTAAPDTQATLEITPRGPLCEDTIGGLATSLATATGEVVIDLRDVTIFSAAAMRVVARARSRGTTVRLVNPSPLTALALDAVGLSTE